MIPTRFFVLAGSMVAAIAASMCCVLPLAGAVLGFTSLAAAAAFEQFRPYLLALTGVFIGGGILLYFKDSKRASGIAGFNVILLATTAVAVAGVVALPYYSGRILRPVPERAEVAATVTTTLRIDGMTCEACATGLQASLQRIPGVAKAVVDYEGKSAKISFDPAKQSRAALAKVITDSSYRVVE